MEPHRFDGITVLPDGTVRLGLAGGVPRRFQGWFDPHPIEVAWVWRRATWLDEKACEIASHGFIAIAPEHPDAWAVLLPDGTSSSGPEGKDLSLAGVMDRVADLGCIADPLESWNLSDPLLRSRVRLDAVAALGFSWGGATTLEFCRKDARCQAAVALDPGGFIPPDLPRDGLQKPSLTIHRSDNNDRALFDKATQQAIWFQIMNTEHLDIGGFGFWLSGTPQELSSAREVNRTVNADVIWFLNKHLKGLDEPMPALKDYPRIVTFKQK